MENYNEQRQIPYSGFTVVHDGNVQDAAVPKKFMANVFLWMFAGLAMSAITAFLFATNASLLSYLISRTGLTPMGYVLLFAPLGIVLFMGYRINKLSVAGMQGLFIFYSLVNGITFSFILLAFASSSIIGCFLSSAAMFGIMAIMGYTTNKDLTSFGRLLFMGLIGVVVAVLINMFLKSASLDYLISIIGVMVFTGLTAYDVQKLKRIGAGLENEGGTVVMARKAAIWGALSLYLDFVNLFLFMLRLFGRRR